jgi:superoxide dismutase, Fe-Mn family
VPHQVRTFDLERVQRIWGRTLELHLGLYKGYVEQLNKLTRTADHGTDAEAFARRFAFEHNGVVLHELLFESLSGKATPMQRAGALAAELKRGFGGYGQWRSDVRELASVRGIGWIALIRSATTGRLHNVWIDLHQVSVPAMADILLLIDLWEHAWILDYAPKDRGRFVSDLIEQLNWAVIEARMGDGD